MTEEKPAASNATECYRHVVVCASIMRTHKTFSFIVTDNLSYICRLSRAALDVTYARERVSGGAPPSVRRTTQTAAVRYDVHRAYDGIYVRVPACPACLD